MRLLSMLTVTLLAATASADSRTVPFELVNVMPSTHQALAFDPANNTHVLLAAGSTIGDFVVVDITGIGVTMENQNERFTVYPRAAQGLALHLEASPNRLPAIYSVNDPAAEATQALEQVAELAAPSASTDGFAVAFASLLAFTEQPLRFVVGS